LQPFVGKCRLVHNGVVLDPFADVELAGLRYERPFATDAIDRAVAGGRDQPGAGIVRRPVTWPALGRDREGFLSGLLGEVEVAEETDQGGQHAGPLLAEDLLQQAFSAPRSGAPRSRP